MAISDYSWGYVFGVLVGDGYLTASKDYHYFDLCGRQVRKAQSIRKVPRIRFMIGLVCKDREFAEKFAEHMAVITGKPMTWTFLRRTFKQINGTILETPYTLDYYRVTTISKHYYPQFYRIKKDILTFSMGLAWDSQDVTRGFLRGVYDSEGSIEQRKYGKRVWLYNKNVQLLKLCQNLLLSHYGIKSSFRVKKNGMAHIVFGSKGAVERFRKEINFTIKRKREILERSA